MIMKLDIQLISLNFKYLPMLFCNVVMFSIPLPPAGIELLT